MARLPAAGRVIGYMSIPDAARKLAVTSSNQSPLLGLFCLASRTLTSTFRTSRMRSRRCSKWLPGDLPKPVCRRLEPELHGSLLKLQNSVDQVARVRRAPADPAAAATLSQANDARLVTEQLAQTFGVDEDGKVPQTVKKLMEDPSRRSSACSRVSDGGAQSQGSGAGAASSTL